MFIRHVCLHGHCRPVQIYQSGIIVLCPVYGPGPKTCHQPEHSGTLIHIFTPLVGAVAISHPCRRREEIVSPVRAGNPLDQYSHLFIPVFQASLFPVFQSGYVHDTGIYPPHCVLKDLQPFFQSSLIYTEHRLIFSCKGIAKSVFQETGGTDDYGTLAEIFQDRPELFPDIGRKLPGKQSFLKLSRFFKIAFFCPLGDPGLPAVIRNNIGIKYV